MKKFNLLLKVRYQNAERTRKGIQPAKSYTQAISKAAGIAAWQAEQDADPHGEPVKITISLREIKPKAKASKS